MTCVDLQGLRVLVTAASRGIGFEVAWRLARMGADVVISSRSRESLRDAVGRASSLGVRLESYPCDLRRREDLERLAEHLAETGGVDGLVFNAGNVEREPAEILETRYEDWVEASLLHLVAPAYLTRLLLPHMVEKGFGRIVYLSSVSVVEPMSQLVLADTSRAGLLQLSRIVARKYGGRGVLSNVVLLGSFDTPGARRTIGRLAEKRGASFEELWEREVLGRIPVGITGDFEGLACLVALMLSRSNVFLNGAVVAFDGGMLRSVLA